MSRKTWIEYLDKIAGPAITLVSEGKLNTLEIEQREGTDNFGHSKVEFFLRTLCGISAWLDAEVNDPEEKALQASYRDNVALGLDYFIEQEYENLLYEKPVGPTGNLVEFAKLAMACCYSPNFLVGQLKGKNLDRWIAVLKGSRNSQPLCNNWLLFAAIIEVLLDMLGENFDQMRVDYAVKQHDQWYKGDGIYGDGKHFHFDYYNSLVIHPMLLEVCKHLGSRMPLWHGSFTTGLGKVMNLWKDDYEAEFFERAHRYAEILERLISPEGTYPCVGRSICYRFGAFHHLGYLAWRNKLPDTLKPGQVRAALTAVMKRQFDAPNTFNENGYLRPGFVGHQPLLAEDYMSTGSLYHCTYTFAALGLSDTDPFWTAEDEEWTNLKAWGGKPVPMDQSIESNV